MKQHPASMLTQGYSWTECPRWHDGNFYFSDLFNAKVWRIEGDGSVTTHVDLSARETLGGEPVVVGGIDWLPDGRMLINSMVEGVTLVFDGSSVEVYADLRDIRQGPINDMVIDARGRVYLSQMGYNHWAGEEYREAPLLFIDEGGKARVLDELGTFAIPNGLVMSADGKTLVAAVVRDRALVAFDVEADGSLARRREFAKVDLVPDGIAMDAEGAVWAARPGGGGAIRVRAGGEITDEVTVDTDRAGRSVACMLGGVDRRTLYIACGFDVMDPEKCRTDGRGSIWAAEVPVSGSGTRP